VRTILRGSPDAIRPPYIQPRRVLTTQGQTVRHKRGSTGAQALCSGMRLRSQAVLNVESKAQNAGRCSEVEGAKRLHSTQWAAQRPGGRPHATACRTARGRLPPHEDRYAAGCGSRQGRLPSHKEWHEAGCGTRQGRPSGQQAMIRSRGVAADTHTRKDDPETPHSGPGPVAQHTTRMFMHASHRHATHTVLSSVAITLARLLHVAPAALPPPRPSQHSQGGCGCRAFTTNSTRS
jgi:hypothetical protein